MLFGGGERRTQSLAQCGRGSCEVQRLHRVGLRGGVCGKTLQHPCDAALMTQILKHLDAFTVEPAGLVIVTLVPTKTG